MAFDMHIKFGAGKVKIEGGSHHKKHKGEVPILAWSWGLSNGGDLHSAGGPTGGGKANVQDISITKYLDGCSHAFVNACATGGRVDEAWLYVSNATGEQTDFLTIHLSEGVLISSYSTGGSGGEDKLTENVTLHFGKFKYSFQPQDDKGAKEGGAKEFTYDIQQVTSG